MKRILIDTFTLLSIIFTCQLQVDSDSSQSKNEPAQAASKEKDEDANNHEDSSNKDAESVWIEYSTRSNGDVFFFDNTRVEQNGKQIIVWTRIRYKTSIMAASSYQNLLRLDCSEHSETILQDTFYTDKDWTKPAMATNTNAKPKKHVQENSATEQLISILCKD